MAGPDPVDVHLLNAVAETGRVAVHELAAHLGMDVRDVAARLAALSTTGLPLVVGVECDPNGIRNALAAAGAQPMQYPAAPQAPGQPSGNYPAPPVAGGNPGMGGPPPQPPHQPGQHSGNHPVYGGPSGPYPPQSGPYPAPVPPAQAPQPPQGGAPPPQQAPPQSPAPQNPPPGQPPQWPAGSQPGQAPPPGAPAGWGPPGSASWTRADQPSSAGSAAPQQPSVPRSGKVGTKLEGVGPGGEPVSVLLVEVVDPADFLFSAAGHTLAEGERAVVVHTELTNRGSTVYDAPPDANLVLVTTQGSPVSKASASLSSRPPHSSGVSPGETGGGHTVFVLPEDTELSTVEWSPRPDPGPNSLTWDISDL
ncbi:AsnC family protein [Actinopolyspora saharensis]|uniref:AsnC family protein n=1 Tax=Actinopolyspora saharensis TaxID=995062 RepID=UPI003F668AA2